MKQSILNQIQAVQTEVDALGYQNINTALINVIEQIKGCEVKPIKPTNVVTLKTGDYALIPNRVVTKAILNAIRASKFESEVYLTADEYGCKAGERWTYLAMDQSLTIKVHQYKADFVTCDRNEIDFRKFMVSIKG